jgi:Tol biopolymer transport system component
MITGMNRLALLLLLATAMLVACDDDSPPVEPPPPTPVSLDAARYPVTVAGDSIQISRADRSLPSIRIDEGERETADVAWSTDGVLRYATWEPGDRWTVYLYHTNWNDPFDPRNGVHAAERQSSADVDRGGGSRLSPDGRRQALVRDGQLYLQELDGDPDRVDVEGPVSNLMWSPRGERLAFYAGAAENAAWYVVEDDGEQITRIEPDSLRRAGLIGWSPDAQRLAFALRPLTGDIRVWVAAIDGSTAHDVGAYPPPPGRDSGPVDTPRWSLDGMRIVVFGDQPYVVDAWGATPPQPIDRSAIDAAFGPQEVGWSFVFSPDRKYFASVFPQGYRSAWKVDLGAARVTPLPADRQLVEGEQHTDKIVPLEVHVEPADRLIAVVAGRRIIITPPYPEEARTFEAAQAPVLAPLWSPDASWLLYSDASTYYVIGLDDDAPRPVASRADGAIAIWDDDSTRIAFVNGPADPDATVVTVDGVRDQIADATTALSKGWRLPASFFAPRVYASESAKNRGDFDVYIADPDGGNARNLTNSPATEEQPALSPDGRTIAFMRNTTELWLMDRTGSDQRLLSSDFTSVGVPEPLAWSPDGRFIAWNRFGELKIVDVATGLTVEPATVSSCYMYFVGWSADSRSIYLRTQCEFDGL